MAWQLWSSLKIFLGKSKIISEFYFRKRSPSKTNNIQSDEPEEKAFRIFQDPPLIKQEQPDPESSCEIVKPSLPTSEIKQEIVDLYDSDDAIPDLDDIPDIPDLDGPDWDERLPKIGETFHQPHEIKQEIEDIPDIPTGKSQKSLQSQNLKFP